MDKLFHIYRLGKEKAKEITLSPEEPHNHDYEELIVGMEGELEHFIDFKSEKFPAPFISFVTKGKLHRVTPGIKDDKFNIWVIEFKSEFIPETTFQLYSYYHDHANLQLQNGERFDRMVLLCEMIHKENEQTIPDFSVIRQLLSTLFSMIESERKKMDNEDLRFSNTQNITFKNFLKILEENFRRPEGVEIYAEKLFMSARNLNLICHNILQKSVSSLAIMKRPISQQFLKRNPD